MACFICEKHKGQINQPPGGYILEDEYWLVCHFPFQQAVLGQLVVESKRHFLDFSEMTLEEAQSYGVLMKRLYSALKQLKDYERIYSLMLLEGIPHFHVHLIPRDSNIRTKGIEFLSQNYSCDEEKACEFAIKMRKLLCK
ncbi:HIT family protein [Heyndrickxia camelliae]|uniref:HIT family protein n=1 Tax=Heyndrickxia camelliae TaxID=1707093 RepID=A0A2N3LPI0_9BACI|nr:hypothetical protein [Heyndrickxia camelliae]PKR86495.1 hypothetical protein CWO92_00020 [Heyndrickxia camelliae]